MAAPPEGVVHVGVTVDVNGAPFTFGHWLLIPDAGSGYPLYWSGLLSSYFLEVGPALLDCMHDGASLLTCRSTAGGTSPQVWVESFSPNHGHWTGGQADNVATGIYVQTQSGRRGSGSRVRLPAVPDSFINANRALSQFGAGYLQAAATALVAWVASVTGPTGAQAVLGTLQTRRGGVPLLPPEFDPAIAVRPSLRVERLARRLPPSGRYSSS